MQRRRHIPSLDGLRGLSIILVLMGHSYHTVLLRNPLLEWLMVFAGNSHLGVMTFFVISGYLITRLLREEWTTNHSLNLRRFYLRRAFKILPTFYLYLAVVTLLTCAGLISVVPAKILAASTFTLNYSHIWDAVHQPTRKYWFVGHFWTLCLEEQFYLLWPLVIWKWGPQSGKRAAQMIVLLCPFLRVATYFLWPSAREYLGTMLHTAADPLMWGCLLALYEDTPRLSKFAEQLSNGRLAAVAAFIAFVASPLLFLRFQSAYLDTVGLTLESLSLATVLFYLIHYPRSVASRLFNAKPLAFIGVLSYSLYVWQQLFLAPFHQGWVQDYPINLVLACGVGVASYILVENPILRLKNRVFGWTGTDIPQEQAVSSSS